LDSNSKHYLIFTDLDDTLLDSNYQYKSAEETLRKLNKRNIPIIFCSNKTFAEQQTFIEAMGIEYPFIVEGGSAIYIPEDCFREKQGDEIGGYKVIILGTEFNEIKKEIESLREKHYIKSYLSMSVAEVAETMELELEDAERAKNTRQFSETIIEADEEALEELKTKFHIVYGGRAIGIFGKGADKGRAVEILTTLYKEKLEGITTIGLGNSYNDEAMLRVVDIPVLVKNPDGNWANIDIDGLYRTEEIGPRGWCESINKIILQNMKKKDKNR
jgi:mannosyl-3-phosphoglycerate phosphatase family protein